MASYTVAGKETVYDYTRRIYAERVQAYKDTGRGTVDDAQGRFALSKLIWITLKKNPYLVSDEIPPDASYIEKMINSPHNPAAYIWQKTKQAGEKAKHAIAVNLDKPAQLMKDIGDALPWYTKPGAIVGLIALSILLPPIIGSVTKGYVSGKAARQK